MKISHLAPLGVTNQIEKPYRLWIVALIPAFSLVLFQFLPIRSLFLALYPLLPQNIAITILMGVLYFGVPGVIFPGFVSFLVSLLFPITVSRQKTYLLAIPVFIVHLFIYSILPFFDPTWVDPNDIVEDVSFQIIWTCILFLPLGISAFICSASSIRLGSRLGLQRKRHAA